MDGARRIAAAGRAAFHRSLELAVTAAASEFELASAPTRTVGGVGQRARPELPAPVAPRRFQIVRCLGYGGMGIVYEAIDRERGGRVALKRLRDTHPECLLRFKREFRCLAGRQHPNWVQAFELIEEDGHWFITMELVEGIDFLTWVLTGAGQRPFNERRLRDGLRQLVRAVAALHDAGKVHRDVKAANVLVTRSGRVVLLDFGLVVDLYEDEFICGESVGTPAYVAPEQMAAEPPDHAADWYSVGVLLYHALTGALPFAGTVSQILTRKAAEDPMRPRERAAGVPDDLEQLCVALLARDPAARPSGRELLAVLADSVDLERETSDARSQARWRAVGRPWRSGTATTGADEPHAQRDGGDEHTSGELVVTSSRATDGRVLISVRDSGVGLPPELGERIFEAFFTTKPQGTGMGLSISRTIIEAHGGRLWRVRTRARARPSISRSPASRRIGRPNRDSEIATWEASSWSGKRCA